MKKINFFALLYILFLSISFTGCSNTKSNDDTIVVGTCADFPPYEYIENENITGLEIELIQALANEIGKKVEIKNMEFDGVLSGLVSGKIDLGVAGISVTPERSEKFDFTTTMFSNSVRIIQRNDCNYQTSEDLKNVKIGIQIGTTAQNYIDTELKDNNVQVNGYKDYIQAITDLENKKIDCIIMDQIPAEKMLENRTNLKISNDPLFSDEGAFAVKKGSNKDLVEKLNNALEKIKTNGTYQKILEKYYK